MKRLSTLPTLLVTTFSIILIGCDSNYGMTNEAVVKAVKFCEDSNMKPTQIINMYDRTSTIRCDVIPKEQSCTISTEE